MTGDFTATDASTWPSPILCAGDTVSVFLGNGDGTFGPQVTYAVGIRPDRPRGGRLHRRRPHRPGRRQLRRRHVSVLLGNGDGTSSPRSPTAVGLDAASPSWRATSPATAGPTWPSPTRLRRRVGASGQGDGTFAAQVTYAVGVDAVATRGAGDFDGDGQHRPGRRQLQFDDDVSVLLGNGDGTFGPQVDLRGRGTGPTRHRGGRLHWRRADRPGRRQLRRRHVVGAAGQRRRHLRSTRSPTRWDSGRSPSWRATSPAMAGSTWPSPTRASSMCRCLLGNGDGTFRPQVTYAVGDSRTRLVAGDFTATGGIDLAVASTTFDVPTSRLLLGNGDGTFHPRAHLSRSRGCNARSLVAGDFNGDGRPTWPSPTTAATTCRCFWATATARSRPR